MAISFKRHRFSPEVICRAVRLYLRFTLSLRDVEELLAEEGIDVSYETIRCWVSKFGPKISENLTRSRPGPSPRWHLDEMVCRVRGERTYLWRAVDDEGEVLGQLIHRYRDSWTAAKFLTSLLVKHPVYPERIITDRWRAYVVAARHLDLTEAHSCAGRRNNNRAENSHLPVRLRERKMQGFKSLESAQHFLDSHAGVYNVFNIHRHRLSRRAMRLLRDAAFEAWRFATMGACAPEASI